ncbi:WYL domain-containing protein [Colwellia piezophila]|uniref:WYL domain-containing protein n=1 Tax=Colwellia piezophila TaxID=211668 RepID=UPI00036FF9B9|nr:WYL domain-containing protein [Colwellia piezophila]
MPSRPIVQDCLNILSSKTKENDPDIHEINTLFDLDGADFDSAIAAILPPFESSAIPLKTIYKMYIASGVEGQPLDTMQSRIKNAVERLTFKHSTLQVIGEDSSTRNKYYWLSSKAKNNALCKTQNMPLSTAMAFDLVRSNFGNILPPDIAGELAPLFDKAKKTIEKLRVIRRTIDASDYVPFSTPWVKTAINEENYRLIFDAIEKQQVIHAEYESVHQDVVPNNIIFSPQQVRVQYEQTQVIGYLHNNLRAGQELPTEEQGIYRHFDINRFKNIKLIDEDFKIKAQHKYQSFDQPKAPFKFVAYVNPWVKENLTQTMFSTDQKITAFEDLVVEEQQLMKTCLTQSAPTKPWFKIEATIELTSQFLDHHDGWDAWFFVNAISMFGADMIVTEPSQVVDEIRRRLDNNFASYQKLAAHS